MTRKTGRKWRTDKCMRCYEEHRGYSGKLDKNGVEYVVCGNTHKRMNISGSGPEGNSSVFSTVWVEESSVATMCACKEMTKEDVVNWGTAMEFCAQELGKEIRDSVDKEIMEELLEKFRGQENEDSDS